MVNINSAAIDKAVIFYKGASIVVEHCTRFYLAVRLIDFFVDMVFTILPFALGCCNINNI